MRKLGNTFFIISSAILFFITACGGSTIGDAQEFSPNEPPSIISVKAVNFDGTEITQLDIEPYKQFKLIIEAVDPDNNPLEYKFDSESGTFARISPNPKGCTAVFKTGSVKGGQNIELWAGVSDGNGAIVRQSFNLGTGKLGPAITASLEKIRFRPTDAIKLSVSANCSGFFQLYSDGADDEPFKFEKDMFRYSYSENKTTEFILGGPEYIGYDDIHLAPKPPYDNNKYYNLVLVFRDGLFQTNRFRQKIYVDGTSPKIDTFSPSGTGVSTNPEVTITFDEEIGYADSSSLTLAPDDGSIKLKSINGAKAVFSVSGLKTLTQYTATVSGIKDIAGNEMASDSSFFFRTRGDGNSNVTITDALGNTSYTAYCGFENAIVKIKTLKDGELFYRPLDVDDADGIIVNVSTTTPGIFNLELKTKDYTNNSDYIIKLKIEDNGDIAEYSIIIKPWYPVTKADEFGSGKIIDQNLNGRFMLMNDIDFDGATITPIGKYDSDPFTGIFDGNDKILKNFNISSGDSAGIFSFNKGSITKLKIKNASIDDSTKNSGIIAGYNWGVSETKGLIGDCTLEGVNISVGINGSEYCGAVAGRNYGGKITNCTVTIVTINAAYSGGIAGANNNWDGQTAEIAGGNVDNAYIEGSNHCGGIVGTINGGEINYCSSSAEVKTTSLTEGLGNGGAGGIAGIIYNGTINSCSSTGKVEGIDCVGGIVGKVYPNNADNQITVVNCHHETGVVKGISDYVGGLIGYIVFSDKSNISVTITKCYTNFDNNANKPDVIAKNNAGGLIGFINEKTFPGHAFVSKCYAEGYISVGSNAYVGGLIGSFECNSSSAANVSMCYSTGTVKANDNAGGLIGFMRDCYIENCYSNSYIDSGYPSGGLVGGLTGSYKITKCYASGYVKDTNVQFGGLVGSGGDVQYTTQSFKLTGKGNINNTFGKFISDNELKDINTFTSGGNSWEISSDVNDSTIWLINGGYPFLNPKLFE